MDTKFSFRVLSICDDDGLRYSRELLLKHDGFGTESVSSDTALSIRQVRTFDAALICPSVPARRVAALVEMLRRYNPAIQVLYIAPLETEEVYDVDLQVSRRPERLLQTLRELSSHATALRQTALLDAAN